jgi:hypothetical protein
MRQLIAIIATIVAFGITVSLPLVSDPSPSEESLADKVDSIEINQDLASQELSENLKSMDVQKLHHEVDLNGMLAEINQNNSKLGSANKDILGSLESIDNKALLNKDISQKLSLVYTGLGGQNQTLGDIRLVTGQQVGLSTNLNNLSQLLHAKMNLISATADTQVNQVNQLRSITLDTKRKMQQVVNQNVQLEKKLQAAAAKSKKADQSMP